MVILALDNGWVDLQGHLLDTPPAGADVLAAFPADEAQGGRSDSLWTRLRQAGQTPPVSMRLPLTDGRELLLYLDDAGFRAARPVTQDELDALQDADTPAMAFDWARIRRAVERKVKPVRQAHAPLPWLRLAGVSLALSLVGWGAAASYQDAMAQKLRLTQQENRQFHQALASAVRNKAGAVLIGQQQAWDLKLLQIALHAPLYDITAYTLTPGSPLQITLSARHAGATGRDLASFGKVTRKNDQFALDLP